MTHRASRLAGRAAAAAGVAVVVVVLAVAGPAAAGGSWLYPTGDRYEAGDEVTLVGYVGPGQLGWQDDGPFYAYIRVDPTAAEGLEDWPAIAPSDRAIGALHVEETGLGGYRALRVSITFRLPDDLQSGTYDVVYCNDPCATGLGDLIGATIFVGTTPDVIIPRDWPAGDPAWVTVDGPAGAPPLPGNDPTPGPPPPPTDLPVAATDITTSSGFDDLRVGVVAIGAGILAVGLHAMFRRSA